MKKKIIAVLCTIITVIPLVLSTPKADNSYTTHTTPTVTSYGQYYSSSSYFEDLVSYTLGPADLTIPVSNATSFTFVYEFKDTYDGYINLSLTSVNSFAWNTTYFYCEGCTLIQQPNMSNVSQVKTFGLQFQSAKKISFTVIHETQNTGIVNPDKIFYDFALGTTTTFSITSSSFTLQPNVADDINYLRGRWDYYVPGMSTNLTNLATDTANIKSNIITLLTYVDNVEEYLTQLKGYVDGIEGYIDGIESTLNNISSYLSDNNNYLNSIYTNMDLRCYPAFEYALSIKYNPGNGLSYDSARGLYYVNLQLISSSTDTSFTAKTSFRPMLYGTDKQYIRFVFYTDTPLYDGNIRIYDNNGISYTPLITSSVINANAPSSSGPQGSRYRIYLQSIIWLSSGTLSQTYDIKYVSNSTTTSTIQCYPLYLGSQLTMPDSICDLLGIDYSNTYTRLLQQISNGVNGTYDTSQYDQYEQTMDELNDSLRDRFNNVDDNMQSNIDTLFTPSGTAGSDGSIFEKFNFNGVNSLFTGILNGIFTSFPAFKYILLFALLLLVIGVMI